MGLVGNVGMVGSIAVQSAWSFWPVLMASAFLPLLVMITGHVVAEIRGHSGSMARFDNVMSWLTVGAFALVAIGTALGIHGFAATSSSNVSALESRYGVSDVRSDDYIATGSHGDAKSVPVSFRDSGGTHRGRVVIKGSRATLYVGSSTEYARSYDYDNR